MLIWCDETIMPSFTIKLCIWLFPLFIVIGILEKIVWKGPKLFEKFFVLLFRFWGKKWTYADLSPVIIVLENALNLTNYPSLVVDPFCDLESPPAVILLNVIHELRHFLSQLQSYRVRLLWTKPSFCNSMDDVSEVLTSLLCSSYDLFVNFQGMPHLRCLVARKMTIFLSEKQVIYL